MAEDLVKEAQSLSDREVLRERVGEVCSEYTRDWRRLADAVLSVVDEETERLRALLSAYRGADSSASGLIERLTSERDALKAENERLRDEIDNWESWSNNLAQHVPQSYDDDVAQEAIVLRYIADATAALDRVRALDLHVLADYVLADAADAPLDTILSNLMRWVRAALDTPEGEK